MKNRIRQIRKDLNMNQTEFGDAIGATLAAYSKYETGKVLPDKATRMLICEKFHVNERWLETGEGEPYKVSANYAVLRALDAMPALRDAFEELLPKLTVQDMQTINGLLEKFKQR